MSRLGPRLLLLTLAVLVGIFIHKRTVLDLQECIRGSAQQIKLTSHTQKATLRTLVPPEDVSRLKVLLIGDIHSQLRNIEMLVDELVLLAGDLVSIPGVDLAGWTQSGVASARSAAWLPTIAAELKLLQQLVPADKLYWVPGNHDPPQLFDADNKIQGNMHGRSAIIADGLRLVGWGGATRAVQRDTLSQAERVSWDGFPWLTEQAAANSLSELSGLTVEGEQQLMLTHCGPRGSGTTSIQRDAEAYPIESGSTSLQTLVKAHAETLVGVLHGHTHVAGGRSSVGFVPVLNGGPLKDGEYAILTLLRSSEAYRVPATASGPAIPTVVLDDGQEGVVASTLVDEGLWSIRLTSGETVMLPKQSFVFKRSLGVDRRALSRSQQLKWRISSFDQRRLPNFLGQASMACDPAGNLWCQQFL